MERLREGVVLVDKLRGAGERLRGAGAVGWAMVVALLTTLNVAIVATTFGLPNAVQHTLLCCIISPTQTFILVPSHLISVVMLKRVDFDRCCLFSW